MQSKEGTCLEHQEYVIELVNANKGGKYNGWEVPYEWLLYQIHREIAKGEHKGMFVAVRNIKEGDFIDPEEHELCFRGFNDGGKVTCFEDFPPIRWP